MEVPRHWRRILKDGTYNLVYGTCPSCDGDIFPISRPVCPSCGHDNRKNGVGVNVNGKGGAYYAPTRIERRHECPPGTVKPEEATRVDIEELISETV